MEDRDSEVMDATGSETPTQCTSQLQRSPISQGGSPALKKTRSSPDPAPIARDAIKWIRHMMKEQATKRTSMNVELQRNMFDMLVKLDTAVHDLVMANLYCQSQLEEARRSAEVSVAAAVAQFGAELRMREAAHEQTLEAVVARYVEKEALRASEVAATVEQVIKAKELVPNTEPMVQVPTFSQALRQTREMRTESSRKMDRSKSRADRRNKLVKEAKKEEHMPSYIVKDIEGKNSAAIRGLVWNQVVAKKS